jgi:hypothetical protein
MIPRYQTILFVVLLLASVSMGAFLWQMRDKAHQRMLAGEDSAPTAAPMVAPAQQATLYVASDADNTLTAEPLVLPLPTSPGPRARAILGKLMDLYAAPSAPHPVPGGGASIAQVFLLPATADGAAPTASAIAASGSNGQPNGPQLAIVNLTSGFANGHPSGLATESLTVLSICATLHANLPFVTQVRFMVDGAPRPTLAGHADLARTYLADQTAPTDGTRP